MSDELRDELARTITACVRGRGWRDVTPLDVAKAVLPIVEWHVAQAEERWEDWSNDLADFVPDSYDDDVAQEAIILRWVEDMVERLADVDRRVAQACAETAESIAAAIEAEADRVPRDVLNDPSVDRGYRYGEAEGLGRAARIARQHAGEVAADD